MSLKKPLKPKSKNSVFENTIAEQAKAYIDSLSDFSFRMNDLSRRLGYSREHVARSFYSVFGLTPKEYFNQLRMNAALELLAGKAKLSEIAETLGYSSGYSLSKAFKKHFGLSPEKYRKTFDL